MIYRTYLYAFLGLSRGKRAVIISTLGINHNRKTINVSKDLSNPKMFIYSVADLYIKRNSIFPLEKYLKNLLCELDHLQERVHFFSQEIGNILSSIPDLGLFLYCNSWSRSYNSSNYYKWNKRYQPVSSAG